jgi:hypothetical protein
VDHFRRVAVEFTFIRIEILWENIQHSIYPPPTAP